MKLTRSLMSLALIFSLSIFSFLTLPIQTIHAQDAKIALQRGYRTGYSDGYMSGYRDAIENSAKNYGKHSEYSKADRAFNQDYGRLEDYRDGYQQGFEVGYDTGFEKRAFDATIPLDLKKRGAVAVTDTSAGNNQTETIDQRVEETTPNDTAAETTSANNVNNQPVTNNTDSTKNSSQPPVIKPKIDTNVSYRQSDDAIIIIPTDTELIVELMDELNTENNKEGDKFTARVVSPYEITGAIIEGRISKIQKPGKIKRRSEMLLSFDRIIVNENRWANLNAVLAEVMPIKGDNVRRVDGEGTAVGKGSIKDDSIKVGAATGSGALVGVIVGGPVGAAVGAGVGAAFGVGAVIVERGKHIRLRPNQQLRIKTAYETQIR